MTSTPTTTKPRRKRALVDDDPPPWVGHWPRLTGEQTPKYHSSALRLGLAGDPVDAIRCAKFSHRVTGKRVLPWQWDVLNEGMLRQPDGDHLWLHRDWCLVDTRQQGKTEIVVWRILYGLFMLGETCVYSAQRGVTADAVFERIVDIIEARPDLAARVINKTGGKPKGRGDIEVRAVDGSVATLRCGVRSTDLGRGLDEIDLVVFDEAYNLTEAEVLALAGAQIASSNAQTIYTSTAPVASVHPYCTIFAGVRERGRACDDPDLLFYEFAAPDPPSDERDRARARLDRENWRLASPSYGVISKERDIEALRKTACVNATGTALWEADYLGWGEWPTTDADREPVIAIEEVWTPLVDLAPELVGQKVLAVSRTQDGARWCIAVGQRTAAGRVALEIGYYRKTHIGEVAAYLLSLVELWNPAEIVIEGHDPAKDLAPVMRKLGIDIRLTNASEFAIACAGFLDAAAAGDISHTDQPLIREALESAVMRELPRGDRVFDTRESSIAQLIAYVMVHWGVLEFAEEDSPAALPAAGGGPVDGPASGGYDGYGADPTDFGGLGGLSRSDYSDFGMSS